MSISSLWKILSDVSDKGLSERRSNCLMLVRCLLKVSFRASLAVESGDVFLSSANNLRGRSGFAVLLSLEGAMCLSLKCQEFVRSVSRHWRGEARTCACGLFCFSAASMMCGWRKYLQRIVSSEAPYSFCTVGVWSSLLASAF